MAKDIPVELTQYAIENDLLNKPGWRRFKPYKQRQKQLERLIKQAKLRSYRLRPKYKYGFEVPRNYEHALELDRRNGNTSWSDANVTEHGKLGEYEVFLNKGKYHIAKIPQGYRQIKVHTIFDVKHDGRHQARVVADGHLTEVPAESVYSGVVSLRGLRACIFLGKLNNMPAWGTDISSAYLCAKTSEKVCIKAGPEFGALAGHLLIIDKALYGLCLSGKAFNHLLTDVLRSIGFEPSKAESSIYMRRSPDKTKDVYEYVASFVDDLCFCVVNPESFLEELQSNSVHDFKLKSSGVVNFHLGCGFVRDSTGTLCMDAGRYVDKMCDNYNRLFPGSPISKRHRQPLKTNDHPELDVSAFCDDDNIEIYQSLIGSMQWAVSIGRLDIQTAVMSMSSFREQPQIGHLARLKRMVGFLAKFRAYKI